MKHIFTISLCFLTLSLTAQEAGCTDTSAANYDSTATEDDGSCFFCYDLITQTFNFTGSVQTFTVPSGVDSVTVFMSGAQGGQSGGLGGSIHANMYFVPGAVLYLYVGGEGGDSYGVAGYNGGGEGQYTTGWTISGGGGGGSSDIRTSLSVLNSRLIVAGGGGGGGYQSSIGGAGGQIYSTGYAGNGTGPAFGLGASYNAGGLGGTYWPNGTGNPGGFGFGGDYCQTSAGCWSTMGGGGGGGSGWWGGGAGGYYSGGGGGTNGISLSIASNVIHTQGTNSGDGQIIISYYQNNFGCTDQIACNYNEFAYCEDESCIYPESYFDCYGYCLEDTDSDGVCDELEAFGCTDPAASNYELDATEDDGSCLYTGCLDPTACNYNPEATEDDGSCDYTCCPGPGCCNIGMTWNWELGICETSIPTDSNLDGCTDLNDLMNLLGAYGDCAVPAFACGDLVSHEGYDYSTVLIGDQCWFAENCRYLPEVSPSSEGNETAPYYYVYDYEGTDVTAAQATANYATYGVLYNWPAVMTEGICPSGWHIPSDAEFTQLRDVLGGWFAAGFKMKTSIWNGSNSSGFTGLPGGDRYSGGFNHSGSLGIWWSTSEYGSSAARKCYLTHAYSNCYQNSDSRIYGFSARCVRD